MIFYSIEAVSTSTQRSAGISKTAAASSKSSHSMASSSQSSSSQSLSSQSASVQAAATIDQSSSASIKASTSQSSEHYWTMSLRNGIYYMEVDVQVRMERSWSPK